MPYSDEEVAEMQDQRDEWLERESALTTALFRLELQNAPAREMMTHGVCRRLSDLKHGLKRVFEILPPQEAEPTREAVLDATAFLQAFVINIFGAMDNLAWLWRLEADVRGRNGQPLHRNRIGLTPDNADLRGSLSARTREYLAGTDAWFEYLEEYRHALAHRIPLYIPPKQLDDEAATEFARLEALVGAPGWDWSEWPAVLAAQRRLGIFEPVMMHSFGEGARPMRLHGQMVCDFATVIEVAEHIVADLKARRAPAAPVV
ncbi:hypothetical protein [Brevundimonas pondensis]|uniref:Cthe-2314-like HEPN domain-containing protein n=1 Tax=Brevundimonas pondensis TaxID=2774189 RepID=A0ABX7SM27_9CAUL|nr:hypothetical protein [Brevundimonas pondensis]QTC88409.1 hypothetical protein IFE19_03180 [Brevundimonas pondensis]